MSQHWLHCLFLWLAARLQLITIEASIEADRRMQRWALEWRTGGIADVSPARLTLTASSPLPMRRTRAPLSMHETDRCRLLGSLMSDSVSNQPEQSAYCRRGATCWDLARYVYMPSRLKFCATSRANRKIESRLRRRQGPIAYTDDRDLDNGACLNATTEPPPSPCRWQSRPDFFERHQCGNLSYFVISGLYVEH